VSIHESSSSHLESVYVDFYKSNYEFGQSQIQFKKDSGKCDCGENCKYPSSSVLYANESLLKLISKVEFIN